MSKKYSKEHDDKISFAKCGGRKQSFVSPDGTVYPDVINVTAFSKTHGLTQTSMCRVCLRKDKHHKGWRLLGD